MEQQATCIMRDIAPPAQAWLRDVFGQDLPAEQQIVVTLVSEPAKGADAAWSTIRRILDRANANSQSIPQEQFDAAVDEAMQNVRPRGK